MRNGLFALLAANKGRGKFHAQATGQGEATIWLYDAIVRDDYWGGVSALTVGKALAEHRDKAVIHLRIDSPGGDVFAGRAMEQLIKEHPGKVIAHIDGFAASAASYVALAAAERIISQGGQFMIHRAWTMTWGNEEDLTKTAGLLRSLDETLVATYADRTGQTPEQLRDWLNAETWFNADQALEYGFATAIAGSDAGSAAGQQSAAASASMRPRAWDLSAYARAPQPAAPANEITDDLTARQAALYDAVEKIAEDFGPFDTGTGPTGAHYVSAADNPFKAQGITCANCALYAGPRACEIVSGDIDPAAACKFWIIPQRLLTAPDNPNNPGNTFDRAAALRRLEACTIAYT